MAGTYIRGAFISFIPKFFAPVPNVIIFQFNPESITHGWTQSAADTARTTTTATVVGNPLAVKGDPEESFTFTLAMDARETIAAGSLPTADLAKASGIYSRLAALELLQFPVDDPTSTAAAGASSVSQLQAPTVLFVWGAGRIVPVRVTSLSITEKLYDELLNPIHADAAITVRVVSEEEMQKLTGPLADIARTAYRFNKTRRQGLATANLANATEGVIGMFPF